MRTAFALAVLLAIAGCDSEQKAAPVQPPEVVETTPVEADTPRDMPTRQPGQADPGACQRKTFEDVLLTHCIADPKQHTIRTALAPEDGKPFRGLAKFGTTRPDDAPQLVFATNGGMFDHEGVPIGYYVEDGEVRVKLNRTRGRGNFHMLPNGVFYGSNGQWAVRTTDSFADDIEETPDFATQSGPMLVIDGELHPRFARDGQSRHIRNGVGIDEQGRAHFVISELPLSLGKLARYFRDELKVSNALYLDGRVSALWNPAAARIDGSPPLGPLIVVEKRQKAAQ